MFALTVTVFCFSPLLVLTQTATPLEQPVEDTRLSNAGGAPNVSPSFVCGEDTASPLPAVPFSFGMVAPVPRRRRQRVVIYARYSTEEQNPRSIDDQIAKCREFVDSLGLGDVEIIELNDAAVSGGTL